jgi:metal-dependent amidase/aminoacylase/carboxypeptidase family protein
MKPTWRLLLALAASAIAMPAFAATTRAPEAVAAALRDKAMAGDSAAFDFVSELTTRFGPRPAGSLSQNRASAWAARKLEALGFENVHLETYPMVAWDRGQESAEIVAPEPQPLVANALGGSPATPAGGIAGEVVIFADMDALRAAPAGSLNGKIAFVARTTPRREDGSTYRIMGQARAVGPIEAAHKGAIGYMLRSIGTDGHRFGHTGSTHYEDGRVPIPAFALSGPDADQIERLARLGEKVRVRLTSTASLDFHAHSTNVVADIRGSERPDEIVLVGGHIDCWDTAPGATDDGFGSAVVVGAAKLIRDLPARPKRTVRVVLYGAEEVTQPNAHNVAGRGYSEPHAAEMASHVIVGESDDGAGSILSVSLPANAAASPFGAALMRVISPLDVMASRDGPGRAGEDVGTVVDAGAPAFAFNLDRTRVLDFHHTPDDTLDKIDRKSLDQNVAAWAALLWLAADSDIDFRAMATVAAK